MDVDSAATFLASSILVSFGLGAIGIIVLALNNLFSRFWKPTGFSIWPASWQHTEYKFVDPESAQTKAQDEPAKNSK